MAIISASNRKDPRYRNTQFWYGIIYICVTLAVLIFLNIYTSMTSHKIIYQSKEISMLEKCQLAAAEIADLEILNASTAASALNQMA